MYTITKAKVTFIPIDEFIAALGKSTNNNDGFATNAFGTLEEGKSYLEGMASTVKLLGGECFVPLDEALGENDHGGYYSDTLIVSLPPMGRLPSLINNAERIYISFALNLQADEKDLVDKRVFTQDMYRKYDNVDVINWDHMVIRLWWD